MTSKNKRHGDPDSTEEQARHESALRAIEKELDESSALDAPKSFEPTERTAARMILRERTEAARGRRVLAAIDEYVKPKWAAGDYGDGWYDVLRRLLAIAYTERDGPADEDYYNDPFRF